MKHNKKRNTAFVFESLVKEITVAIMKNDSNRKNKTVAIVKKHFTPDSMLRKHLDCYKSLYENQDLPVETCEKILQETKVVSRMINQQNLFNQQTELINDINKELEHNVFGNFVPNYKTLATIDQIFSSKTSPKNKVMLEGIIVENMAKATETQSQHHNIDNLTMTTFVNKFNEKYSGKLLDEQKELLNYYITSFVDNAVELKMFLNEELSRLKTEIGKSDCEDEVKEMTKLVTEKLRTFRTTDIDAETMLTILQTQQLVEELNDGSDH